MKYFIHNIQKKTKEKLDKNNIDKIYVISFQQDIEKQNIISTYFKKHNIDFIFFDAVDGNNDQELIKKYTEYSSWTFDNEKCHKIEKTYKRKLVYSVGAFGLLASYKNIFNDAIQNNYNNIIIFEDDVLLDNDFDNKLKKYLQHIKNFDIIYLGCSHHVWNNPNIENIPSSSLSFYKAPVSIDGSFATIYNKKVFTTLVNLIDRYNAPYDLYLRHITKNNDSYVLYPNISIADTTSQSRISGQSRNLRTHAQKIRWSLKNIDFSGCQLKTSVLMANFNNEITLKYALDSVTKQTYKNTEIIIVDDNSNDNSVKTIKKWIDNNKNVNIKFIELTNNVGAYKCRNIALSECSGFFVTLLDPDDIFLSKKIENDIYNYFNLSNYEIFFSRMYRSQNIEKEFFSDETLLLQKIFAERDQNKITINNNIEYPWNYQYRLGMPTIFVEKLFFEKYGQWRDDYRYGMDIEIIQRYIVKKHNTFIDNQSLFRDIHTYQSSKYDIYCSNLMNYVSFPMGKNNATNLCSLKDRQEIHSKTNLDLQKTLR